MTSASRSPARPAPAAYNAYCARSVTSPPSAVEAVHRGLDAVVQPAVHGVGHRVEQGGERGALLRREGVEHEVGEVVETLGGGPHPDPEARILPGAERGLHALEAVVPAGRAGGPEPEAAR